MIIPLAYHCPSCDAACECSRGHRDIGRCALCGAPAIWLYGDGRTGTLEVWCSCRDWHTYELRERHEEPMMVPLPFVDPGARLAPARCPECSAEMREIAPDDWGEPLALPSSARTLESITCVGRGPLGWRLLARPITIVIAMVTLALIAGGAYAAWRVLG